MSNHAPISSRTGLNASQVKALQNSLNLFKRGTVIDVPVGSTYGDLENLGKVGEDLTQRFTRHFLQGSWRVHFMLLDSDKSNAYAYWMNSFEAVCVTSTMAREIDALCGDVARYLIQHPGKGSGFAYIHDVPLSLEVREASLKGLLMQGAMAFLVGHEAGHLAAGHKPVLLAKANAAGAVAEHSEESDVVVDQFVATAKTEDDRAGKHSLRLNAHEVDADVQGFALTAVYWLTVRNEVCSEADLPHDAALILAACSMPERLLLLASTGAAITLSLMGFKEFKDDWNSQSTHPLTSVRCVVGLGALGKMLGDDGAQHLPLELRRECWEALSLVHSRLGSLILDAARYDGNYSAFARQLENTPREDKLNMMFRGTGVAQAVEKSNEVVSYLAALSAEFNACAPQRANALRVPLTSLIQWSAADS